MTLPEKRFSTAEVALQHLNDYLSARESLHDFCAYVTHVSNSYDDYYGEDDDEVDHSDDLVWFFCAEGLSLCQMLGHGHTTEPEIRADLQHWVSYLEEGEEKWRAVVHAGGWPIPDDEPE